MHTKIREDYEKLIKSEELKLEKLKVDIKDALRKCEIILKQHEEKETQVIIILQNDKGIKWNISYVTQKFNLINIKIDAETGELVNQNIISMLSWGKIDDGKD